MAFGKKRLRFKWLKEKSPDGRKKDHFSNTPSPIFIKRELSFNIK